LDDARVEPSQPQRPTLGRVDELQRVDAEPARELGAAGVRQCAHLDHGGADPQSRARRQVGGTDIEVDVELVAGGPPALAVLAAGHDRRRARVYDRYLGVRVGSAVATRT